MKGLIIKKIKSKYFTDMKDVFFAIGNVQKEYNWLITNYECNIYPSKEIPFNQRYVWIDGKLLTDIVMKDDILFIWGVFSAFKKNESKNKILKYSLPFADGNKELWSPDIHIQHPLAEVEIVSWDSSLLLLISRNQKITNSFLKEYPDAIDLEKYNSMD